MTQRLSKEELDKQFELFLKESVSDDSVDLGVLEKPSVSRSKSPTLAPKPTASWWEDDKGSVGSGKSFLKSLRKTSTIREEEKDPSDKSTSQKVQNEPQGLPSALGPDTLEEQQEKEQFFADLEAGASSAIDFSKFNRELGSTSSSSDLGIIGGKLHRAEEDKDSPRGSAGSPHYSDDFEAEDEKELKQMPKMSPILAKVSLLDSLDDTKEETKKSTTVSMDKAQSGGSELEALARLLQIHALQDPEGLNQTIGSRDRDRDQDLGQDRERDQDLGQDRERDQDLGQDRERDQSPASSLLPGSALLHRASTLESDLPTAEELMKKIRPEEDSLTSFRLHPLSSEPKDLGLQSSEEAPPKRQALSGWTVDLLPDPEPAPVLDLPPAPTVPLPDPPPPPLASDPKPPLVPHPAPPPSPPSLALDPKLPQLSDPKPPLVPDPTRPVVPVWSVAEELERLMQDQENPTSASRTSRGKKVSLPSGSSVNRTFQPRSRDTRTTPVSRPSHTGLGPASRPASGPASGPASRPASGPASGPASRPASGPASGPASRPASGPASGPASRPASGPASGPASRPASGPALGPAVIQTQSKSKTARAPVSQPRRLPKGPERSQPDVGAESRELVASVQSLVSVLQQQVASKHTEPETPLSPLRLLYHVTLAPGDCGDHVVIVNSREIAFSGNKWEQKVYSSHTGYPGGFKQVTAAQLHQKDPEAIMKLCVYGMLPKNLHRRTLMQRLHIFADDVLPDDIALNLTEELPQPREIPRTLREYSAAEREAFPRLWNPPEDYKMK